MRLGILLFTPIFLLAGVTPFVDEDEEDPEWSFYSLYAPSRQTDLSQWMNFVFEKTPAEIQQICNQYPVMKKKYDVIREAMLENGFDLSKLEL